jgi:hypothetical protein
VPEKVIDALRRLAPQYRLPQVATVAAPSIAQHFNQSSFVWPPLGSLGTYAVSVATIVVSLCFLLPTLIENKQQARRWLKWTFSMAIFAFAIYAVLVVRYVITVQTPNDGPQTRSVGFRVDPRLRAAYPAKNDPDLLQIGGLEEWQIETVWTPGSVRAVRLGLLGTFSLTLGLANIAFGATERLKRRG